MTMKILLQDSRCCLNQTWGDPLWVTKSLYIHAGATKSHLTFTAGRTLFSAQRSCTWVSGSPAWTRKPSWDVRLLSAIVVIYCSLYTASSPELPCGPMAQRVRRSCQWHTVFCCLNMPSKLPQYVPSEPSVWCQPPFSLLNLWGVVCGDPGISWRTLHFDAREWFWGTWNICWVWFFFCACSSSKCLLIFQGGKSYSVISQGLFIVLNKH